MPSGSGRRRIRQQRKRRRCKSERPRRRPEPQERAGLDLERAAVSGDTLGKLLHDVAHLPDIAETFVISTCNRVEVYAEVDRFHGGVAGVCELLSRYSGIPAHELTSSLYVHYEDRAVQHLLAVSSGLESMVVGEDQILGQVRSALKLAGRPGDARPVAARPRAARAAHRQAGPRRDRHRPARPQPGQRGHRPRRRRPGAGRQARQAGRTAPRLLAGLHVLVVGAGAMSGLAVATAARAGAARVTVANRTRAKAERLARRASAARWRTSPTCPPPSRRPTW